MKIYYTDIRGADEAQALYPPTSNSKGSAFGASLLAAAYAEYCRTHRAPLPQLRRLVGGKPFFPSDPDLHFSISHSRTHVLCALSRSPVGADTLDLRPISAASLRRLATPQELDGLSFHQLWCLRESFYKLTGEGSLRKLRFYKENDKIIAPRADVFCRLYDDIPDSAVAVSAYTDDFPDSLTEISLKKLLKKSL